MRARSSRESSQRRRRQGVDPRGDLLRLGDRNVHGDAIIGLQNAGDLSQRVDAALASVNGRED